MEEDRHHLKPKRTGVSHVEDVPPPRHGHEHKRAAMIAGVTLSMVVIIGLYAASFRFRDAAGLSSVPRWSVLTENVARDAEPFLADFAALRDSVNAIFEARTARAAALGILKEKLAASASGTEETPPAQEEEASVEAEE